MHDILNRIMVANIFKVNHKKSLLNYTPLNIHQYFDITKLYS